ncbi:MAG: hypothetical protein ACM31C_05755, partial [Acidobacteriota bacterium]
ASTGHTQLAWAYTVLECQSPAAAQCTFMWQRYAKLAPTQTDALNLLHAACGHAPAACEQMATWHTERGHALAAAAYRKRAEAGRHPGGGGSAAPPASANNALALATDLAAIMHVSGAPRTDAIDQMVTEELQQPAAPVAHAAGKPHAKAWRMHAALVGTSSDGCTSTALLDRHQVSLDKCIVEVRPFDGDQIAILNRCSNPVDVAYAASEGANAASPLRLDQHEARSIGISHTQVGTLTYAVCADGCRVTGETGTWSPQDMLYNCSK